VATIHSSEDPLTTPRTESRALVKQQAGGHAVGQHHLRGGGPAGQDGGGQRMPDKGEPDPEHVQAGSDGEEPEHPLRCLDVSGHAGAEEHEELLYLPLAAAAYATRA